MYIFDSFKKLSEEVYIPKYIFTKELWVIRV